MRLLAIDPGKRAGWAIFESWPTNKSPTYYLSDCGLTDGEDPFLPGSCSYERIVCERPSGSDRRAPSDDLVTCGIRAGLIVGYARAVCVNTETPTVEWVYAVQWKGSVPKPIQNKRDQAKLTGGEYNTLVRAVNSSTGKRVGNSMIHNVLDAIGIGLWAVGRK